jgi:hypothetical protein
MFPELPKTIVYVVGVLYFPDDTAAAVPMATPLSKSPANAAIASRFLIII